MMWSSFKKDQNREQAPNDKLLPRRDCMYQLRPPLKRPPLSKGGVFSNEGLSPAQWGPPAFLGPGDVRRVTGDGRMCR
jgi:hypothetical protein